MKVLIVTKDTNSRGGVSNYFRLFFQKFSDQNITIDKFYIGSRPIDYERRQHRKIAYFIQLMQDLTRFFFLLWKDRSIDIVQVNPSLIPVPLCRDGLILLVSKIFRRKTIVFFHGWSDSFVQLLNSTTLLKLIFLLIYNKTNHILVLANSFSNDLKKIGFDTERITVTRTMFDSDLIQSVSNDHNNNKLKFMFLSRISVAKGTFEIIQAMKLLKNDGIIVHVNFFGHGATTTIINELKLKATELNITKQCHFLGYIDGEKKYQTYQSHDVFLLPSYHEGCPTSVLEAMASGCFIISTGVGALQEVVLDGSNGRITQTQNHYDLAKKIKWVLKNKSFIKEAKAKNQRYALKHYSSDKIIKQLTTLYRKIMV